MPKAEITTPQGIRIKLEGTIKEIADILEEIEKKSDFKIPRDHKANKQEKRKPGKALLVDHIASLLDSGFFKKPRDLAGIKSALAEMGHHYPVTTLSPTMLRQVRGRKLRRMREKNRWLYVQ